MADDILKSIGIENYKAHINSLNCGNCSDEYIKKLKEYFESKKDKLCGDCARKLDRAPIRILDCKNEDCKKIIKDAPKIKDSLCGDCNNHYDEVRNLLKELKVDFTEDVNLVRGLDYYTGVVFEFITDKLGPQQNTLLEGGRYDNLVKELGGKNIPATGFALGIDRIVEVLSSEGKIKAEERVDVFIVADEKHLKEAFVTLFKLRENGIRSTMSFEAKSFKAQMREADSKKAKYTVIIGESEVKNNSISVKNMNTGTQKEEKLESFISGLK